MHIIHVSLLEVILKKFFFTTFRTKIFAHVIIIIPNFVLNILKLTFNIVSSLFFLGDNVPMDFLRGGVVEMLSDMIGKAAHHFLGVDPQTGRIIGAIAGNVLFHLGGKDNQLSDIGKIILDNIISGKFHRKVNFSPFPTISFFFHFPFTSGKS